MSEHELHVLRSVLECLEWHISAGSFGCDIEGVAGELRSVIENQVSRDLVISRAIAREDWTDK